MPQIVCPFCLYIGQEKLKLMRQCADLKKFYPNAYLLIEGRLSDLFQNPGINPNAVWGWLVNGQSRGIILLNMQRNCQATDNYKYLGWIVRYYAISRSDKENKQISDQTNQCLLSFI